MKTRDFLLSCAVGFLLIGCAGRPEVTKYVNPVSGRQTDVLAENLLDTKQPTREMLWLNAYRDFKTQAEFDLFLEVIYAANKDTGLLEINPGRSLTIIVDGEELKFDGLGGLNTAKEQNNVISEQALYRANAGQVHTIANGQKVVVRVTGKNGIVVREFAPENFEKFRRFADQISGSPEKN